MKRIRHILVSVLLLAPAAASAQLTLGVGAGGFVAVDDAAYGGEATELMDRLGSRGLDGASVHGWAFGLSQSLDLGRVLQLHLRERLWVREAGGHFAHNPELDFERTTMVVPLTAGLRFALDGRVVGFRAGGGVGGYLVDIEEKGHLGDHQRSEVRIGGYAHVGIAFFPGGGVAINLEYTHDWVELPELNPLFTDGGQGGGGTFALNLEFTLGGDD